MRQTFGGRGAGVAVLCAGALLQGGCGSLVYQGQEEALREQTEMQQLKLDVARMRDQLDQMRLEQNRMKDELFGLTSSQGATGKRLEDRVTALERASAADSAAREQMRSQIVSDVSQKIGGILKSQSSSSSSPKNETGYEHVVKAGETLSAIAAAYKVKPATIIQTNNLKDGNSLRVGQKLFIPAAGGGR